MGYTHYFYRKQSTPVSDADWNKLRDFTERLEADQRGIVADAEGLAGTKPYTGDDLIAFNGVEEYSHETLCFTRDPDESVPEYRKKEPRNDDYYFAFCKTARKPYDTAVVAFLKHAERMGLIRFESDGDEKGLEEGVALEAKLNKGNNP